MISLGVVLFACFFALFYFWLKPYIKRGKGREVRKENKPKKPSKVDVDLEKSLSALNISWQKFRLWDIGAMAGAALYEFAFTRDILSAVMYALVGRMLIRIFITFRAAHLRYLQDAQTQQFVRGLADNLGIGEPILEAAMHSAQRVKEPLRGQLTLAIHSTRGNRTLPEAMKDLGEQLRDKTYKLLSRVIGKGIEKGQRKIADAFKLIDGTLTEGEKSAKRRARVIMTYFYWLYPFLAFNFLTPPLMQLIKPDLWDLTTHSAAHWVWFTGAVLDLFLASGLKKFTRIYAERNGMET